MKHPPRFAIAAAPREGRVEISGGEFHHLRDVRRLNPGDSVAMIDPAGAEYRGSIERIERGRAIVRIGERVEATSRSGLILAIAVIKGPRMDFIVEKAAELGADELWPLVCERCVVEDPSANRLARWRRLATGAAKQSLSPQTMVVREAISLADLIREARRDTLAMICAQGAPAMSTVIHIGVAKRVLIAVGPEGDFSPAERRAAADAGFVAVGLGPNRLRSETAAIAALAIAVQTVTMLNKIERNT